MTIPEQPRVRALYSQAVAGSSSGKALENCHCSCGNSSHTAVWPDKSFFEKLKNFVLEIFSLISTGESSAARSLLATSAIRNNFGIDLTTNSTSSMRGSLHESADASRKRPLNSPDGVNREDECEEHVSGSEVSLLDDSLSFIKKPQGKHKKRKKNKAKANKNK